MKILISIEEIRDCRLTGLVLMTGREAVSGWLSYQSMGKVAMGFTSGVPL